MLVKVKLLSKEKLKKSYSHSLIDQQELMHYSQHVYSNSDAHKCIIDWTLVPAKTVHFLHVAFDIDDEIKPNTVHDLAKSVSDHKLFAYLEADVLQNMQDVCCHGLDMINQRDLRPTIYFVNETSETIGAFRFVPGTRELYITALHHTLNQVSLKHNTCDDFDFCDVPQVNVVWGEYCAQLDEQDNLNWYSCNDVLECNKEFERLIDSDVPEDQNVLLDYLFGKV